MESEERNTPRQVVLFSSPNGCTPTYPRNLCYPFSIFPAIGGPGTVGICTVLYTTYSTLRVHSWTALASVSFWLAYLCSFDLVDTKACLR
jgi:hypothetical protein